MTHTVLIPARLASTRLPNKPLADIGGLPMVVRVAQRITHDPLAVSSPQVVVACDSQHIVDVCSRHGVRAILTRQDHASGSDRLAEACDLLELADDQVVVNVQGDEPLIDPALVQAVAAVLVSHPQASMGTAAHPIALREDFLSPHVVKVVLDAQGFALYFSRAPIPFARDAMDQRGWNEQQAGGAGAVAPLRHIGIYSYRARFLRTFPKLAQAPLERAEALEQLRAMWHGHRIAVTVTPDTPGLGIDTPEDLARVRELFMPRV